MNTSQGIVFSTAVELRSALRAGEVSCQEVLSAYVDQIDQVNPTVNAVVAVADRDHLYDEARRLDNTPSEERGALFGLPVLVKDNVESIETPTTYGAKALAGNQSDYEALVVTRLREADAIVIGKTNTPEWACLPVTDNELFGPTPTPWNLEHTSGGSSGGAAAAVAAGMAPLAQGNDGGGSIRIPASCCGVVGIKPTRGRVPWAPKMYECWEGLATNGPLARTVADAALMLDVMSGPVVGEPYSVEPPTAPFLASCGAPPPRVRVAFTTRAAGDVQATPEVREALVSGPARLLSELGHFVEEATPDFNGIYDPFMTILKVNGATDFQQLGLIDRLGEFSYNTQRIVEDGLATTAAEYCSAIRVGQDRSAAIMAFWNEYDVLLTPTVPTAPIAAGAPRYVEDVADFWAFSFPANMTGQPAIAIPCGFSVDPELPIGCQLVGRPGSEELLLKLATQLEQAQPWSHHRPDVAFQMKSA